MEGPHERGGEKMREDEDTAFFFYIWLPNILVI